MEVMTAHPETQQCVLQAAEGLDVQVVGGLVEQQHAAPIFNVNARLRRLRSPREHAGRLLLVWTLGTNADT